MWIIVKLTCITLTIATVLTLISGCSTGTVQEVYRTEKCKVVYPKQAELLELSKSDRYSVNIGKVLQNTEELKREVKELRVIVNQCATPIIEGE